MNISKIIYPSPSLSEYVKYYWILRTDSADKTIQTIPSGCIHLVFHRGDDLHFVNGEIQVRNFIRGQLSGHGELISHGAIDMIAVIFHPLGLTPFTSLPLTEVYNQYIDIEYIGDKSLTTLKDRICSEEDSLMCVEIIEKYLISKLNDFQNYNYSRILGAIRLIEDHIGLDITTLANTACLGYRHFKREFSKYIGMSPKEYLRIIRFQRVLYTLQKNPKIDLGELAYICGFYDNSHLNKDFKSLSGCSPTDYLSSRKPHSTFFSNDSKLNLIKQS